MSDLLYRIEKSFACFGRPIEFVDLTKTINEQGYVDWLPSVRSLAADGALNLGARFFGPLAAEKGEGQNGQMVNCDVGGASILTCNSNSSTKSPFGERSVTASDLKQAVAYSPNRSSSIWETN